MYSSAALESVASSILAVLLRSDSSSWLFRPLCETGVLCVSKAFEQQWNLKGIRGERPLTIEVVNLAFAAYGIDAKAVFASVVNTHSSQDKSVVLTRSDSLQLKAEISAVTSVTDGLIIGHLIHFRELIESNLIDAILQKVSDAQRKLRVLSPREQEILQLVFDGRTNKAISISTCISEKTVEKHRSRIMQKLDLNAAAELFRLVSTAMMLSDFSSKTGSSCLIADQGDPAGFSFQPPMNC